MFQFVKNISEFSIPLPKRFIGLLYEKHLKFDYHPDFTYGYLETNEYKIHAIAIVHPKDHFNRKLGRKIVEGRINCFLTDSRNRKEEALKGFKNTIYIENKS